MFIIRFLSYIAIFIPAMAMSEVYTVNKNEKRNVIFCISDVWESVNI